jgi:hypothetical protein
MLQSILVNKGSSVRIVSHIIIGAVSREYLRYAKGYKYE